MAGGMIAISGAMLFAIPLVKRCTKENEPSPAPPIMEKSTIMENGAALRKPKFVKDPLETIPAGEIV